MSGIGTTIALIKKNTATITPQNYLTSGGNNSGDTNNSLKVTVDPATYTLEDVPLVYNGGIITVAPNTINGKIYLYNNSGVGAVSFGVSPPANSIILATYDSDATKIIRFSQSGNFAIVTETNKLTEDINENAIIQGSIQKNINTTTHQCTIAWTNPIKIILPSMTAGAAYVNIINPSSITLNQNELVYVTVNRSVNNSVISISKVNISSANMTTDDKVLFLFTDTDEFHSFIGGSSADMIDYGNADYPTYLNVKSMLDALADKVFYVSPQITAFANNVNVVEKGSAVNSVNLNWTYNKTMSTASLDNGIGSILPSLNSYSYVTPFTANKTFTLTCTDNKSNTAIRTTSVLFQDKRYWGVSTNANISTSADMLILGGSEFATSYVQSKTFNCTGGRYVYFCFSASLTGTPVVKSGGLSFAVIELSQISFTNLSGYTSNFRVFRSANLLNDSALTIDIT